MSDQTPRLSLPLLMPSQAQKHVTHNEAIDRLDGLVQLVVQEIGLDSPPGTPAEGAVWQVGAAPVGDWIGQSGSLARWRNNGWDFITPETGWLAWDLASGRLKVWDGSVFAELPVLLPGTLSNLQGVGIGTTPDALNRLAVSAGATLLSHSGGGHQVKVNKAGPDETASLLFQSNWSGRAEIGLPGNDDLSVKVSADGATFAEALVAEAATGMLRMPQGVSNDHFSLRDSNNPTRVARFQTSGITAGQTRTFTFPNTSGEIALLSGAQTFSGTKTFSGAFTVSATTASLGSGSGDSTISVGSGATPSGGSKTVNIGTAGLAGSTTQVTIGSGIAGSLGQMVIHLPTVTFGATVTEIEAEAARIRADQLGLGGAVADATVRLNVTSPVVQIGHAGAGTDLRLNKAAPTETAALTLQSGGTGRGQIALAGSDNLALRVSGDGVAYQTALSVPASGRVMLPVGLVLGGQAVDPPDAQDGWLWYNQTSGQLRARQGGATTSLVSTAVPFLVPPSGEHVMTSVGAGAATATTAGVANRMEIFPFLPRADLTVDQVAVNVTTAVAGALGKVVIFAADSLGRPDARLFETADLDFGTTGVKSVALSAALLAGVTYWLGLRHSATATVSAWSTSTSPDINGGAPATAARKTLRRTLAYGTAAPAAWGFVSSELSNGQAPAIWLRMA